MQELINKAIQRNADDINEYIKLGWDRDAAIAYVKERSTLGVTSWEQVLAKVVAPVVEKAEETVEQPRMTTHELITQELATAGLVMGDLTKPGWMHTLSNGRRMWVQAAPQEPLEDLFGAKQTSMTMTVVCPDCCGSTHTIFTYPNGQRIDYRQCDKDRTHERVRV